MEFFYPSLTVVVLMHVWFETDAFVVYMTTFNLGGQMFDLHKYKEESEKNPMIDYHTYLLMTYPSSFFIKLFTCPVCLMAWVAPIVFFFYNGSLSIPIIFQEIILTWTLYFTLKLLVKKSDG